MNFAAMASGLVAAVLLTAFAVPAQAKSGASKYELRRSLAHGNERAHRRTTIPRMRALCIPP